MLMKSLWYLSLLVLSVVIVSCNDDGLDYDNVNPELQPYIDRFVEEAALRDIVIDIDDELFEAHIGTILESGVLGQCRLTPDGEQQIVIHSPYWNQIDDIDKEYVVFHELGHCLIGRGHTNETDIDGNCASIMQTGEGACNKFYTLSNREELINELFE